MAAEVTKKLFTVNDYYSMAEAGIIGPDERVELVEGEIIQMSPIGHRHGVRVVRASTMFFEAFGRKAVISTQGTLRLNKRTEFEPDLVVFKPRADFYVSGRAKPADVLLVVEMADSSLSSDRKIKIPLYAAAGIPEVWIQDIENDLLLVYRDPREENYATSLELQRNESVSPNAFPEIRFSIDDLFGGPIVEIEE
jgi:Uma2 family endonuclease